MPAGPAKVVGIDDLSVYVPRLFLPLAGEFSLIEALILAS